MYSKVLNIHLDIRYTGEDYGNNKSKDRVMPAQIPELAKQNFPLCMKSMQEVLEISQICPNQYTYLPLSSPGSTNDSSHQVQVSTAVRTLFERHRTHPGGRPQVLPRGVHQEG